MNIGKFAAIGQIVLSLAASVGYFAIRDWRHGIYWGGAAIITAAVTF